LTAQELQGAITELSANNGQFKNRVADLLNAQQKLAGMWQGDANNAFNTAFNNDKGQWDTFAQLMDKYIETLQTIKNTYETAEAANTQTAATRSY
jgi:WXG100 family type VII secretion target